MNLCVLHEQTSHKIQGALSDEIRSNSQHQNLIGDYSLAHTSAGRLAVDLYWLVSAITTRKIILLNV